MIVLFKVMYFYELVSENVTAKQNHLCRGLSLFRFVICRNCPRHTGCYGNGDHLVAPPTVVDHITRPFRHGTDISCSANQQYLVRRTWGNKGRSSR
jgi:hypothetical protein